MNLILENTDQVAYFTDMRSVISALGVSAAEYDWHLSDLETNYSREAFPLEDRWIQGEILQQLLVQHDIQFIWGVFSAVPKGFRASVQHAPNADGNPYFWSGEEVKPQLEGALFEIVCWDSSATILIGISEDAGAAFIRTYSDTRPLSRSLSN
ncbi:hypothetical protein ACUHMQ_06725 [Chitinimonas sp. PSY-7]|uniref:hypothetical protein n=1 Tax=Chitinimonas sp. PSY-7 TaxID=3459088 RepID=UPI00404013E4